MATATLTLKAENREKTGKASAHQVRKGARLPAVIYGPGVQKNVDCSVDTKEFEKAFKTNGKNIPLQIELGGKTVPVIVKDVTIHPITRNFLHADFYAFVPKKAFTTDVPLKYVGNPVGVKEGGGLYVFARKLSVTADIDNLPPAIEVDITNLKIAQYLIVRDIKNPAYRIRTHEGTALVEIK